MKEKQEKTPSHPQIVAKLVFISLFEGSWGKDHSLLFPKSLRPSVLKEYSTSQYWEGGQYDIEWVEVCDSK